jgi:hypothetical protein
MTKSQGKAALTLRIELAVVTPAVWRRLVVPGDVRLDKISLMLQEAMGWTNSHLHAFDIQGRRFGMQLDDFPDDELDEHAVTAVEAIGDATRLAYEYDFGDSWDHEITVEERSHHPLALKFAVCVAGENNCPPEDVGGPFGYAEFLAAMKDPANADHDSYATWIGGAFDATAFDLVDTNARLQRLR